MRGQRMVRRLAVLVAAAAAATGCGYAGGTREAAVAVPAASAATTDPSPAATVTPPASPRTPGPSRRPSARPDGAAASRADCLLPGSGFDCPMQRRIHAAESYARSRPGVDAIVVRDR